MKKFSIVLSFIICIASSIIIGGCSCSGQNPNLSSYQIECSFDGDSIIGREKVTFYNSSNNSVDHLKFNLFGNAFRKGAKYSPILAQYTSQAYPNGINYGEMTIDGCYYNDQALAFEICGEDQNILKVSLKEEVFPNESVTVKIDWNLKLANVVARTGINDKTINLGNFYPILCAYDNGFYECLYYGIGDPFYSDCANYKVTITTPEEWTVAGGGNITTSTVKNQLKTTSFTLNNARSFAMVLSRFFQTETASVDGVNVAYYYYEDTDSQKSISYAVNAIKLFNQRFGKYPYDNYTIVQTKFVQGGMEYPTITLISDSIDGEAYGEVIVHETAHQWWQTTVGNNEIEYGFLDEALAEYSVVIYYEHYNQHGLTRENMIASAEQTYRVFCSVVDRLEGKVDTSMLRNLSEYTTEYEYVNVAYIKGCIMFDYLRQTIGDKRFFDGLRRYYKEYSFKNATPDDLVGVYEKIGADSNGFFESFYLGKVII